MNMKKIGAIGFVLGAFIATSAIAVPPPQTKGGSGTQTQKDKQNSKTSTPLKS